MLRPGTERVGRDLGAVEELQPVAVGIARHQEIGDMALLGEAAGAARDLDAVGLEMGAEPGERRGVRDLPAEEADALAAVGIDDEPLLAVVHPQAQRRAAAVDRLEAEQPRPVPRPIVDVLGAQADVTQRLNEHATSPAFVRSMRNARAQQSSRIFSPAGSIGISS